MRFEFLFSRVFLQRSIFGVKTGGRNWEACFSFALQEAQDELLRHLEASDIEMVAIWIQQAAMRGVFLCLHLVCWILAHISSIST